MKVKFLKNQMHTPRQIRPAALRQYFFSLTQARCGIILPSLFYGLRVWALFQQDKGGVCYIQIHVKLRS